MRSFATAFPCRALAALGAVFAPAAMPPSAAAQTPAPSASVAEPPASSVAEDRESVYPGVDCLASTLCNVQDKVRWGTPAWSPDFCRTIAGGVLESARANDISPTLILGVMMNESSLDEKAAHVTMKGGRLYAKDSGLMGIRCILRGGRCTNGYVKGMSWRKVMDPLTNIELGARELARWR